MKRISRTGWFSSADRAKSARQLYSLSLLERPQDESSAAYLNWDVLADRQNILAERVPSGRPRVILDEIHKYANWRNLMKGLYDKNRSSVSFIVTGSARLD